MFLAHMTSSDSVFHCLIVFSHPSLMLHKFLLFPHDNNNSLGTTYSLLLTPDSCIMEPMSLWKGCEDVVRLSCTADVGFNVCVCVCLMMINEKEVH